MKEMLPWGMVFTLFIEGFLFMLLSAMIELIFGFDQEKFIISYIIASLTALFLFGLPLFIFLHYRRY